MIWFKFLAPGAVGPFSGHQWPAPSNGDGPGDWLEARPPLEACRNGIHVCRPADLPLWLHHELYAVEAEEPVVEHDTFVLARRARLVRRIESWTQDAAYALSCDCAWRVRDLAATSLHTSGRAEDAERLAACATLAELRSAALGMAHGEGSALVPYAADAAMYAAASGMDEGWAGPSATTAFVAARAAKIAAAPGGGRSALAAELSQQARWLMDRVLTTADR